MKRELPIQFLVPHSALRTRHFKMAAQVGFAPTPFRLTGERTTIIPLSKNPSSSSSSFVLDSVPTQSAPTMSAESCQVVPYSARRTPHSALQRVTAAGLAPAVTWSQARHVAPTLRGGLPRRARRAGAWVLVETDISAPWQTIRCRVWRFRWDLHPHPSRRQRVAQRLSYGSILNLKVVAGVGIAPT